MEYKFLCCNKNYQKAFEKNLKSGFPNKYKFSNHDINKFILFLRKGVYPYEYIRPTNLWELKTWRCFQKFWKIWEILPKTWRFCRRDFVPLLLLKLNSNMLFQPFLYKFNNQLSITLNLLTFSRYLPLQACIDASVHLWPDYI